MDDSWTFADLGLCDEMVSACSDLGWRYPTEIQAKSIPAALSGRDICGTAETGSGKTGAYLLPAIHRLLDNSKSFFCLVLAPTRELCTQIDGVARKLGASIHLRVCTIIGGVDEKSQIAALKEGPHIVVATPGRLAKILKSRPGVIHMENVECLVFDEADEMLREKSFQNDIDLILGNMKSKKQTFLFSATMPEKIEDLSRRTMSDPLRVSLSSENVVAKTITEYVCVAKTDEKEAAMMEILAEYNDKTVIVFAETVKVAFILQKMAKALGHRAVLYHGKLPQRERQGAVDSFRDGKFSVLIATNVGSRGLDVPSVDVVVNYGIPDKKSEYVHRVGRAGRAERSGVGIILITVNELVEFARLEAFLEKKLQIKELNEIRIKKAESEVEIAKRMANESYKEYMKKQTQKKKEKRKAN